MSEDTQAIISGAVRTLAQFVPLAGGAIAQAWSEFEAHAQNKRINEFFDHLAKVLEDLQKRHSDLRDRVARMPDAAELLERAVAAAKRETSNAKRMCYPRIYAHFIENPDQTTPDERLDIIFHVEQLSEVDINLLAKFRSGSGVMRGDMLTDTVHPAGMTFSRTDNEKDWLATYGHIVHSLAKLEARGLLMETQMNAIFSWAGNSAAPFNRFREKAWRITPIGLRLLSSLAVK